MDSAPAQTYCLFCLVGQEQKVIEQLKRQGYIAISPQVRQVKTIKGVTKQTVVRMLQGYVFFEAEEEPDWNRISRLTSVLRVLRYDDGERAMRGGDLEFAAWLKRYNGIIEVTRVIKVGTKIEFVDGPLKELAGRVIKVNKNRKQVQVELGGEGSFVRAVWCSIEYIGENVDTAMLGREQ